MAWSDEAREAALRARAAKAGNPGDRNQLKIAADTLRMPDAMAGVMGGPSKDQARSLAESAHPTKSAPVPTHPYVSGSRRTPRGPGWA